MLEEAIIRGLANDAEGLLNPEERRECAIQTAARQISQMIHGGHSDRVLAIWSAVAPRGDEYDGRDNPAQSALLGALERLPETESGSNEAGADIDRPVIDGESGSYMLGPTEFQSVVPLPEPPEQGLMFTGLGEPKP